MDCRKLWCQCSFRRARQASYSQNFRESPGHGRTGVHGNGLCWGCRADTFPLRCWSAKWGDAGPPHREGVGTQHMAEVRRGINKGLTHKRCPNSHVLSCSHILRGQPRSTPLWTRLKRLPESEDFQTLTWPVAAWSSRGGSSPPV